ncbi:MAG: hypothetical protein WCH62_07850 [Candidatus Omnitrophota bacterium]
MDAGQELAEDANTVIIQGFSMAKDGYHWATDPLAKRWVKLVGEIWLGQELQESGTRARVLFSDAAMRQASKDRDQTFSAPSRLTD